MITKEIKAKVSADSHIKPSLRLKAQLEATLELLHYGAPISAHTFEGDTVFSDAYGKDLYELKQGGDGDCESDINPYTLRITFETIPTKE